MSAETPRRLASLFSTLLLLLGANFPISNARRGISTLITIVLIFVIIIAGAAIIFVLVFFPGAPSTTTIYP